MGRCYASVLPRTRPTLEVRSYVRGSRPLARLRHGPWAARRPPPGSPHGADPRLQGIALDRARRRLACEGPLVAGRPLGRTSRPRVGTRRTTMRWKQIAAAAVLSLVSIGSADLTAEAKN